VTARYQQFKPQISGQCCALTVECQAVNPLTFVSGPAPVCVDEFQHVPEILDAIKAELNRRSGPGRFVLTGSTRYETLPRAAQSLTGRATVVPVWPLSQGEIHGVHEARSERLLAGEIPATAASSGRTSGARCPSCTLSTLE